MGLPAARRPKVRDLGNPDGIVAEIARAVAVGGGVAAAWSASCFLADGLVWGVEIARGGLPWIL